MLLSLPADALLLGCQTSVGSVWPCMDPASIQAQLHEALCKHSGKSSVVCLHKTHPPTFTHPGESNAGKVIPVLKDGRCQKASRQIRGMLFCLAAAALAILICNYSFHLEFRAQLLNKLNNLAGTICSNSAAWVNCSHPFVPESHQMVEMSSSSLQCIFLSSLGRQHWFFFLFPFF